MYFIYSFHFVKLGCIFTLKRAAEFEARPSILSLPADKPHRSMNLFTSSFDTSEWYLY